MAAPAASALELSEELRAEVLRCARANTLPHRLVIRAQIILAAANGQSTYVIARSLGCAESTVRKWRGRVEERPWLTSLEDLPRSGRPAVVPVAVRCEVIKIACARPEGEYRCFGALWTMKSLSLACDEATGYSLSTSEISRILTCSGLKPHRVRSWLHSPDPLFREKVQVITDLYAMTPPGSTLLSFDEKTGMQALEHKHPMRAGARGESMRKEFEYKRHGTVTLLAALDVRTGEVIGRCARRTGENEVAFFDELATKYPRGPVYVVMDNLNVHKGARWEEFNERHGGRFHFVFTPLHASWVNQIEIWFSILQRRVLRHNSFASQADLTTEVLRFISYWNYVEARPFRWTFRGFERTPSVALAA